MNCSWELCDLFSRENNFYFWILFNFKIILCLICSIINKWKNDEYFFLSLWKHNFTDLSFLVSVFNFHYCLMYTIANHISESLLRKDKTGRVSEADSILDIERILLSEPKTDTCKQTAPLKKAWVFGNLDLCCMKLNLTTATCDYFYWFVIDESFHLFHLYNHLLMNPKDPQYRNNLMTETQIKLSSLFFHLLLWLTILKSLRKECDVYKFYRKTRGIFILCDNCRYKIPGFATPATGASRQTLWTATPKDTPMFDKRLLNVATGKP